MPLFHFMPTLEQATEARLREIADIAQSGATEMTGKGRRDSSGAFVGRFGGLKPLYPELQRIRDTPKQIAEAIRRGQGRRYERVYRVVSDAMAGAGYVPHRKRSPGRPTIPPHEGKSYCLHCRETHTRGQHRFHGPGAYHHTHLFSFGGNPVNVKAAKAMFAHLMQVARARGLSATEREQLKRASQVIRYDKRAGRNPGSTRKEAAKTARTLRKRIGVRAAGVIHRIAKSRGYIAKKNPGVVRMGKLVEIRYERDHGKSPGLYKHEFKVRPTIYFDRATNTITIRGGR